MACRLSLKSVRLSGLQAEGGTVSVSQFVRSIFGFQHGWLGFVAAALVVFSAAMWLAAVWGLRYLKFHKR